MNKQYKSMADKLAKAGRFGDDRILHVSQAELEGLGSMLPSGKLPINPETGQPEAFILTSMLLGAAIGGLTGGLSAKEKNIPLWQGILQGAGIGGATSALTAGLGSALGGAGGTAASNAAETAVSEGLGEALSTGTETALNKAFEKSAEEATKTAVSDAILSDASSQIAQSPLDSSLASNPMLQTPGSSIAATPPAPAATPSSVPVNPAGPPDLLLSTGPNNPIGSVPTGPPPASPQIPLDAPAGPMPQVTGPGSTPASQVAQPSNFLADQFTEEAAKEALASFKNPLNVLAPAFMAQSLLPYEEDEEDYLAGYYGPYNKTWASGSGVSWAARNGGMVPRPRLDVSFNQGGLASLRRR